MVRHERKIVMGLIVGIFVGGQIHWMIGVLFLCSLIFFSPFTDKEEKERIKVLQQKAKDG